jgi:predicted nucleic acid-binding protein
VKRYLNTTLYRQVFTDIHRYLNLSSALQQPQDIYIKQAFEIAVKEKITVYIALFMAQAFMRQVTLISSDKEQCKIAEKFDVKTFCI